MRIASQTQARIAAAAVVLIAAGAALPFSSGAAPSASQLRARVSQQRSREHTLSASVAGLSQLIAGLQGQIELVQSRESAVRAQLATDRVTLAGVQASLGVRRRLAAALARRLARARVVLARELVGGYEADAPDLLTVVLSAHGFTDLLERLDFLRQANRAQQRVITTTRTDKAAAQRAAARLGAVEARDRRVTSGVSAQVAALSAMDGLLGAKRGALSRARSIQVAALRQTHTRRRQLEGALTALLRQQASATFPSPSGQPSGPWAIPTPIVMCESGGQNLPPNAAGASGYYQIVTATWKGMGGSTPAAYLASKAEQDRVATALWNGGAGASNWVCASLVH
jgi:Transglycosylase-like domain